MRAKMKIVGLTLGDPLSTTSRSGVNYNVFTRLKNSNLCELIDVYDLDLHGFAKIILAAKKFSFNRVKWGNKLHQSPDAFKIRTRYAETYLKNLQYKTDLIYQDGAMFYPGKKTDIPFVSYHDSNAILSAKGGKYAHGSHYAGRILRETLNQEKLVYENATIIFTMSDWLKSSLIDDFGIKEEKIKTVYAGTNLKIEDFNKSYDGRTILFVGNDFKRKGGQVLLEAFKVVKTKIKDAKLKIVGPHLAIDQPGVELIGNIADKSVLEGLFKDASIFVLPSLFEPFGIVFAEAFTYKTPCIGTNICAMPEIIEDGKGGFTVPTNNISILADKIINLLEDEKLSKAMGEFGFKKVQELLNWDVVVQKMINHCVNAVNK